MNEATDYFVYKIGAKPDLSRSGATNFCNADVVNAYGGNNNNASNVFGVSPDLIASP
jgi:hypothetical protein